MVFRTKVDLWLIAVVVAALGSGVVASVAAYRESPTAGGVSLLLTILPIGVVAAVAIPTEYHLNDTELVIRWGVFRTRVPYDAIERVYPTRNPLSAPAWSLDRLGIDYRVNGARRLALISPHRQDGFLDALQQRVPLEFTGKAWVRGPGSA